VTDTNRGTAGSVAPATGKLAIFTPGLGAVATTLSPASRTSRTLHADGLVVADGHDPLGKRTENRSPLIMTSCRSPG
jgi:myo-inositol-1-phosphate synthase